MSNEQSRGLSAKASDISERVDGSLSFRQNLVVAASGRDGDP